MGSVGPVRVLTSSPDATGPGPYRALRVHGELKKLGFKISERTVSRLMPKTTGTPSQTWMTFLRNHVGQMVSIDFFTVATIQLRVLYVFIVLAHDRRRVLHFNVTEHPTATWTAQQIVEAFPEETVPRYLVRDRDGIYGHDFVARVDGLGVKQVPISARSPWQNCYAEPIIGSIRRECLKHLIVMNEWHLGRILKSYFCYYHRWRTHLSLDKDAPESRPVQDLEAGRIVQIQEVGGLHHRYEASSFCTERGSRSEGILRKIERFRACATIWPTRGRAYVTAQERDRYFAGL
jgi:putative transposase